MIRKNADGKSFPDFVGALILEEISSCLALRTKYRAYKQEEALKRQAEQEEQDRAFCEERNRKAEQMIDLAIRTIRGGGTLKNDLSAFTKAAMIPALIPLSITSCADIKSMCHFARRAGSMISSSASQSKMASVSISDICVPKVRSALKKSLIVCTS